MTTTAAARVWQSLGRMVLASLAIVVAWIPALETVEMSARKLTYRGKSGFFEDDITVAFVSLCGTGLAWLLRDQGRWQWPYRTFLLLTLLALPLCMPPFSDLVAGWLLARAGFQSRQ